MPAHSVQSYLAMPPKITPERLEDAGRQVRSYYAELSLRLKNRGMKPLPDIRIYVSRKMKRNYGYAAFRRTNESMTVEKIAISWSAFRKGASMWNDVVAHEAAHAYCMAYHNRADHSPSWRHVAQLLGCTGDLVGCEDAGRREFAKESAPLRPTVHTVMTPRDQASVRLSLKAQKVKFKDERAAIEATVGRFPQFDERKLREYLFKVCGIAVAKPVQLGLPF
jgi:hypothetical protein